MTIHFTVPSSFQADDCLPQRLWTRADDARWLVSVITCKDAVKDVDEHGYARLSSNVLRRVMYHPTQPAVVRSLVDAGVLEIAPHCTGIKNKGYRLHKQYLSDRCVRICCSDPRLADRIQRERERLEGQQQKLWLPVHHQLAREQEGLTIAHEADDTLAALPDHCRLPQSVLVDRLRRRVFYFTVGSTGRVFGNFSNLKSELRSAVRLHGQALGGVDIVASQPSLLAAWLLGKIPSNGANQLLTYKHPCPIPFLLPPVPCPLPPDIQAFATSVLGGYFYEELMSATGMDRPTVKLSFLRDVLAPRRLYPSFVLRAFRESYPSVLQAIRAVNQHDHARLIRVLQSLESWLVIGMVVPRLLGTIPVITLHDSIFSHSTAVDRVFDAFRETFNELDLTFQLHTEN